MLTRKQHELLRFIQDRLEENGISPSFEEMKEALDLKSKSGVHRLISALEERGFIRRLPNRARALEIRKLPEAASSRAPRNSRAAAGNASAARHSSTEPCATCTCPNAANSNVLEIPLHGRIAAGVPIEAIEGTDPARSCRAAWLAANIMRWRSRATRWSRLAFLMATSR